MSEVALDVGAIREASEKATPGPWKVWAMEVLADPVGDSNLDTALPVARTTDSRYAKPRTFNANYIATMDPPTTLALLDALAAARAEVERLTLLREDIAAEVLTPIEALADEWRKYHVDSHPNAYTLIYGDAANLLHRALSTAKEATNEAG